MSRATRCVFLYTCNVDSNTNKYIHILFYQGDRFFGGGVRDTGGSARYCGFDYNKWLHTMIKLKVLRIDPMTRKVSYNFGSDGTSLGNGRSIVLGCCVEKGKKSQSRDNVKVVCAFVGPETKTTVQLYLKEFYT